MVRHGGSSAGSYLTDPTSPIPSHCASIVTTSTLRVKLIYIGTFTEQQVRVMRCDTFADGLLSACVIGPRTSTENKTQIAQIQKQWQ